MHLPHRVGPNAEHDAAIRLPAGYLTVPTADGARQRRHRQRPSG